MPGVVELLSKAYVDEWFAFHQYWAGAKAILGPAHAVGELLEHANDERRHADAIYSRLVQLGARPIGDPSKWAANSNCRYVDPEGFSAVEVLEQNLEAEKCAIAVYRELLRVTEETDKDTSSIVVAILEDEMEHERDLNETLRKIDSIPLSSRQAALLPFSKRAAMERLPIHLDPSMWKPEELMEVFKTPKLMEMLRNDSAVVKFPDGTELSRFEAGIRALQKAGIKIKDLMPHGPENWLTHGTFALMWGTIPISFYRTRKHAERARNRVISSFVKGVSPVGYDLLIGAPEFLVSETTIEEYWPKHPEEQHDSSWVFPDGTTASPEDVKRENTAWEQTKRELERVRHPVIGAPIRKRWAEKVTSIMPIKKKLADHDYAEGDEPTVIDYDKAQRTELDPEITELLGNRETGPMSDWEMEKEILRPVIDAVKKRIKAKEDGVDLDMMSDDELPLSSRATRLVPISKRAQDPVRRTAESIVKIINFLMFRVPDKDKARYMQRIRGKILRVPTGQMSQKKMPQTAAIGQSISLVKNILSGLNPFFVKRVMDEVANLMLHQIPARKRTPIGAKI